MHQVPLYFPFSLAFFYALFGSVFLPHVHLIAFSPFLALLYNKSRFVSALWIASLCGLIIDLLSSEFRLGIHALNYCLTTLLLYKQKKHFFEDKPLALCLFTLLISITSTLLQVILVSIFDRALPFSSKFLLTDFILMPVADSTYAFVWFSCPMIVFSSIKKTGWPVIYQKLLRYLHLKQKNENLDE